MVHSRIMGKGLSIRIPPNRFLLIGFIIIIVVGSMLLTLPISQRNSIRIPYLDALFTSFSAVCVTGLVTVDVAETFSIFGRTVIAMLILLGGMGFAAVIMSIVLLMGWDVGISQRTILSEAYNLGTLRGTVRIVKTVILSSFVFQMIGTLVNYSVFRTTYAPLEAFGHSLFHSISAFNNAGFDLMGDFQSMTGYRTNIMLNASTMLLIVIGGMGFFVITDMARTRMKWKKFSMHTRIVIVMTLVLIVIGTVSFMLIEKVEFLAAIFQSVTARTAGFNTLDIGSLSTGSLFIIIVLMFIGASPGSTGGGIKTTTTFAVLLSLSSLVRRSQPVAFSRKIPAESLTRAFQVLMLALLTVTGGILIVSIAEGDRFSFMQMVFEVVSAYGTVGLSTGITTRLNDVSKIILMVVMFIGRLGPITVATSLSAKESVLKHVEERIFIG